MVTKIKTNLDDLSASMKGVYMTNSTNLEELQRLSEKVTGKPSTADSIADAIFEIANAYKNGSGSGETSVVSAQLYPDSKDIVRTGEITLSDGSVIAIDIVYTPKFDVNSVAGSTPGTTLITVDNTLTSGNSYRIDFDRNPSIPAIGENVSDLAIWDGISDIEAEDGSSITVIEATSDGKVVKAGQADVTIQY